MRKIILYIACSIDGYIAKPDGDVSWLESIPDSEKIDYGYHDFYNTIDTTIMGYSTYQTIMNMGIDFPYPDKTNYVCTRKKEIPLSSDVTFITDNLTERIKEIQNENGKDIWLIGGGQTNTLFLDENLIDEVMLFILPITIGDGIPLFSKSSQTKHMECIESTVYSNGAIQLHYKVGKESS